jgi:hypothetical protein
VVPQGEVSPVKEGIDLTLRTIEGRACLYRNLLVVVSALLVGSAVGGVVLRSWWPLVGVMLVAPATGTYFALDTRQVHWWTVQILGLWRAKRMSLAAFSSNVLAFPSIPKETVRAMIATLPVDDHSYSVEEMLVVLEKTCREARRQQIRIAMSTAQITLALGLLCAGAGYRSFPLVGCAVVLCAASLPMQKRLLDS